MKISTTVLPTSFLKRRVSQIPQVLLILKKTCFICNDKCNSDNNAYNEHGIGR